MCSTYGHSLYPYNVKQFPCVSLIDIVEGVTLYVSILAISVNYSNLTLCMYVEDRQQC